MAKEDIREDEDGIVWEERLSEKGNKYRVGYIPNEGEEKREASPSTSDHVETVLWIAGSDYWIDTDDQTKAETGIYKFKIPKAVDSVYYEWQLTIDTKKKRQYLFRDESGDHYYLGVVQTLTPHYVYYNSDQPNIDRIFWKKW